MCDKELLVGYLYDELSPADRSKCEAHLFACAECRNEVAGLRDARVHLAAWVPPQPDLGFQIVRGGAGARARHRPLRARAAWGVAAAAALLLAVAAAMANLEVTIGGDGLVARTGWARDAPTPVRGAANGVAPGVSTADEALRAELRRMESRVRELEAAVQAQPTSPPVLTPAGSAPRLTDAALRQIRAIVAQSEERQQRELALQVAQLLKDLDLQRRSDLARIQQGLGRLEAYTGAEVAQQRQTLNRFLRVSQGR